HDELDRCMERGARGLKLHLWFHRYRLPDALPVLERAASARLPVLAHLGFGPPEDVEMVLEKVPSLKLILAHAGIPHFERLWRLPGVLFDVAAPQLVSRGTIKRMVAAVGPSRVVFGSDAPVGIRARAGGYPYDTAPRLRLKRASVAPTMRNGTVSESGTSARDTFRSVSHSGVSILLALEGESLSAMIVTLSNRSPSASLSCARTSSPE